jgi:hypothetical protein
MLAASQAGTNNIKVASVADLGVGQKLIIGSGDNSETAVVAALGTSGGTVSGTATNAGTTVIPVASVEGFGAGQIISIDEGVNTEAAVVASVAMGRRRFGATGNNPTDTIRVTVPLAKVHAAGSQVSGSGITFTKPLTRAHDIGSQVTNNLPTPGEPNQYIRKP